MGSDPPYPPSRFIRSMTWHWDTYKTAAPGSDLWPVTWGPDGNLYAAWGDGGGFGGTNDDGRVAMGFARIKGSPENMIGENVNGGKNPLHPASFPTQGKTGGILSVDGVLYAWENMQDGVWPNVNDRLDWSDDLGATWRHSPWVFPRGPGLLKPGVFLNFGKDYAGVPHRLRGFVYFTGVRQGDETRSYLGRAPQNKIVDKRAYEFFEGVLPGGRPLWSRDVNKATPIFIDERGGEVMMSYDPGIKRYLASSYHGGPGQLGIFDAPEPWGPWTTVAYYEDWGKMGSEGEGLTCSFPEKWMSKDGLTAWCVFSVYGPGAKEGINAHDRFNLVKTTLQLANGER
ncbi:MAG TPA: DUF4185 domain-containing protein [Armatimonadota bacterium]|nr:DUF4185 domain-containing protein [Armatimonadota bacterium]